MGSKVPGIDAGARRRLTARFGSDLEAWLDELPGMLTALVDFTGVTAWRVNRWRAAA
jgi:hypothetical protein